MAKTMEPVVKELVVPVEPARAFRRFTEEMGTWWPRETHSVFEARCTAVRMEGWVGGRLYEVSETGEEAEWGRVTAWEPPARVAFTWHPGRDAETAQEVEATFEAGEGGTRLRLVHGGWEVLGDAAHGTRQGYDTGWDHVLGLYREALRG